MLQRERLKDEARYQQGFSLVEILVALVILAFGLLSLGMFNVSVTDHGEVTQERTAAVHLAEQIMEDWQNSSTDSLPSVSCTPSSVTLSLGTSTTCTPTSGLAVPFTIKPTVVAAMAPLPDGSGGISSGALTGSPTPEEKVLKISWSHKGTAYSIYLTHITRAL